MCRLLSLEDDFEVVAQAEDGLQASELLRQYEPDILLLDFNMLGSGGLATLQKLQEANYKTRVILLSASDDENHYVQAFKLGSCGIVQKQTATELLIDCIRRVYAGEFWIDPRTAAAVLRRVVSPDVISAPPIRAVRRGRNRSKLSDRECEIVKLIAQGLANADIATQMCINEQTIKNYLHNIFKKLGVTDRLELALYAVEHQIAGVRPHETKARWIF